ncbi:MAG: hypothetical protein M3377_00215 [Actinomycetota bacterium]|nr:hypothetical protein [Actinomycetota bacterium]
MELREERMAVNQTIFRAANEAIGRAGAAGTGQLELLCECGDRFCLESVEVPRDEYERVRSNPACFLLATGHQTEGDRTEEEREGYVVATKGGRAREIALQRDPRADR